MDQLVGVIDRFGPLLFVVVGFVEFAGAPVASVPILVVAGALVGMGELSFATLVVSVALGGLLADSAWYAVARWRGERIVGRVCGLSSNPRACVGAVEQRVADVGPLYLVPAKFIPATGNLIAAASGLARIRFAQFVVFDGVALLLWAAVYAGVGVVFAGQVERAIGWAASFGRWVLVVVLALIGAAAVWRVVKVRLHQGLHGEGWALGAEEEPSRA